VATPSTGEPTLSIAFPSPLKPQKSTSLSESIEKAKTDKIGQVPQNLKFVADAIKADKIEGDKRKRFLGETSANIYSTVIEPNIDIFVSQKDEPTMYGTQKIPAGTVNTDAIYEALDAYDDKYFEKTGENYYFFKGFVTETFYNQQISEVKYSLSRFFDEIFNLDGIHTMSDLDLLKQVGHYFDQYDCPSWDSSSKYC
jgi:hypothetical protein